MKIYIALLLMCFLQSVFSQVYVKGYFKSNGTYVEPHYRSSPNGSPYDNYSYPGNVNPYTGKVAGGSEYNYLKKYNGTILPNHGCVSFYTNCGNDGTIDIYINGIYAGYLNHHFKSDYIPEFNQVGTLTVSMPCGEYDVYATSTNSVWKGKLSVTNNETKVLRFTAN